MEYIYENRNSSMGCKLVHIIAKTLSSLNLEERILMLIFVPLSNLMAWINSSPGEIAQKWAALIVSGLTIIWLMLKIVQIIRRWANPEKEEKEENDIFKNNKKNHKSNTK